MNSSSQRRFRIWRYALILIVLIVLFAAACGLWFVHEISPRQPASSAKVWVTVARGDTVDHILDELEQEQIIRSAFTGRILARITGGHDLQAGQYHLSPSMSVKTILEMMENGETSRPIVSVVIPEGYTVTQIAARLQTSGVCTAAEFLKEEQTGDFPEAFVRQLPTNSKIKYRLEGYLFPDTYQFYKNESAHDVINEMLEAFASRITPGVQSALKQEHIPVNTWVTEASLVEREAKVEAERPIIASVIGNRLQEHPQMKLQIDATIEYILGHRSVVTDKDLRVQNPYNTYLYPGLPPGPIANPGLASLTAVLHPAKTKYLYYVVKNNGTGEHYFAETYQEQLANEAKSRHNLQEYEALHH